MRPDVALLNAPVMSYAWFAAQRALYPGVVFPGTRLRLVYAVAGVTPTEKRTT